MTDFSHTKPTVNPDSSPQHSSHCGAERQKKAPSPPRLRLQARAAFTTPLLSTEMRAREGGGCGTEIWCQALVQISSLSSQQTVCLRLISSSFRLCLCSDDVRSLFRKSNLQYGNLKNTTTTTTTIIISSTNTHVDTMSP